MPALALQDSGSGDGVPLRYRLCPCCARAVPIRSTERYCVNDGTRLMEACPVCGVAISSPYARFCADCGHQLIRTSLSAREEVRP